MKAIRVENPGPNYRLDVVEIEKPTPREGQVLVKVAAAGLNRADLLQASGNYPPPPGAPETLGLEISGTVAEFGPGASAVRIGDEICALLTGGGYAEYALASVECILPVPKGLDVVSAAALPEVHFTVWTNLIDSARLREGDRVLVHGGSSGIGTAAIQLCVARGHKVFATAGSKKKCDACEKLGASAINYREQDFVEAIRAATDGAGVDVILDMVGGSYIERNFHAAARDGRIVNVSFMAGIKVEVNFAPLMMKRLSFTATALRSRSNTEKGAIRDAVQREVWPLIEKGRIKPVIDEIVPLADAGAAHARMRSSDHIGKLLLRL